MFYSTTTKINNLKISTILDSNKVLELYGNQVNNNRQNLSPQEFQLWQYSQGGSSQTFTAIQQLDSNTQTDQGITNQPSFQLTVNNRCLDVAYWDYNQGYIANYQCTGGVNQKWILDNKGRIHSKGNPYKCLDIYGATLNLSNKISLSDCNEGANQKWAITDTYTNQPVTLSNLTTKTNLTTEQYIQNYCPTNQSPQRLNSILQCETDPTQTNTNTNNGTGTNTTDEDNSATITDEEVSKENLELKEISTETVNFTSLSQRIEELNAKDWDELMQNFDPYSTCNDCNYLTLTVQYGLAIYKLFDYLTSWISGLVDGIGLEIWNIIKSVLSSALHPVETIRGIYEAIKIISSQPEIMIQAMMESVYKDQLDAFTSTNKNYRAYYYSRAIARFGVLVFTTGASAVGVIKGIVKLGKSIKDKVLLLPKSTIQDTRVYRVLHNTTVTLKNTNIVATLVLIGEKLYIKIGQILTQLKALTTEQFNSFLNNIKDSSTKTKLSQSFIAELKSDGYYHVNSFKFSKYYYEKLWSTGRGAPGLTAGSILKANPKITPDTLPGFYRYETVDWELVFNPTTREVWHIQPIK